MEVKLFPRYLPWLKRPEYLFTSKVGNSDWTAEDVRQTIERQNLDFDLKKKAISLSQGDVPSSLSDLFGEYDLGKLNMLWTNFWSEPRQRDQGWGFADMSEVNIVVGHSGRIEAYNAHPILGMPGATDCLGVLAKDLESYLEALFYGQFNKTHFISGFPEEDPILFEKTVLVAKHCALIAGGYEYYDFWAGLLGLPPTDTVPE